MSMIIYEINLILIQGALSQNKAKVWDGDFSALATERNVAGAGTWNERVELGAIFEAELP